MRMKKQIVVIVAALAATSSLVLGQGQKSADSTTNQPIVGTWQVLRHGVDCVTGNQLGPDFPALMTFNAGGTLNAYAIPPNGTTPANTSPEYGTWTRGHASHNYTLRDVSYGYDANGAFTGRGEITATVTLDSSGNSFTYHSTIDVYDANGNLLFSFCGAATGTRFE